MFSGLTLLNTCLIVKYAYKFLLNQVVLKYSNNYLLPVNNNYRTLIKRGGKI